MQAKREAELNTNHPERQEQQEHVSTTTAPAPSDKQKNNADLLNHDAMSEHLFFNSRKQELDLLAKACTRTIAPQLQNEEAPAEMPVLRRR